MATGLLIGPVLGLAHPDQFKDVTHAFGTLALILILFEGGLDLNIRATISHFPGGLLFGLLTYAFTTALVGWIAWTSLGMTHRDGLIVGAIVGCTSSTIVLPVLQQWKAEKAVKIILLLESTLGDILGVLTVGFLLQYRVPGASVVGDFLTGFFSQILISLAASFLIGYGWSRLLPYLSEQQFWQVLTFSMVLLLYAGTEYLKGSGLLAVLGFGLALSNLPGERPVMIAGPLQFSLLSEEPHEKILSFHSELSFLVRTFFFVLIGVVVQLFRPPAYLAVDDGRDRGNFSGALAGDSIQPVDMARSGSGRAGKNPLDVAARPDYHRAGPGSGGCPWTTDGVPSRAFLRDDFIDEPYTDLRQRACAARRSG